MSVRTRDVAVTLLLLAIAIVIAIAFAGPVHAAAPTVIVLP